MTNRCPVAADAPTWPPLLREPAPVTEPETVSDWVAPVDEHCPPGYPIKVNTTSGIYHVPDGRSYARTVAQRCYATAEAAERDGYRRGEGMNQRSTDNTNITTRANTSRRTEHRARSNP